MTQVTEQKLHPISTYLKIWVLLFVLSACSYLVDFYEVQSYLRWTLIIIFMFAKAGLIVAFFMHLKWERLALIYTILSPPLAILVFIALMSIESDYVFISRITHFVNLG
ncbi:MAG: cytochrome c oxidase subunit 4 [Paraglaciecola sp.]|jgi:cytochrome c oxidase subunit 4